VRKIAEAEHAIASALHAPVSYLEIKADMIQKKKKKKSTEAMAYRKTYPRFHPQKSTATTKTEIQTIIILNGIKPDSFQQFKQTNKNQIIKLSPNGTSFLGNKHNNLKHK
jgi:hypothetical protein